MKTSFALLIWLLIFSVQSYAQSTTAAKTRQAKTPPGAVKTSVAKGTSAPIANMKAAPVKTDSLKSGKAKPVEWSDLDLSKANPPLPVILKAPVGSTIAYDNGIVIYGGDSTYGVMIDMSYSEPPAPISDRKKEAVNNISFKFEKFIADKPDLLIYSTRSMREPAKSEYHFEAAVQAGGEIYYIHDRWDGVHRGFTLKEIEAMVHAAQGLHK